MNMTTFNQIIGNETIRVSIPETRVERIIDKVDLLIDEGKLKKARAILDPFIAGNDVERTKVAAPVNNAKGAKKEAALTLITELIVMGHDRKAIINKVAADLDMTYANARHYVVNVAKVQG